jgi:hypothetical protein
MRIRRTAFGLYGEARTAVTHGHAKDGIHVIVRPVFRSEIVHPQAGLPQPPHRLHKHISIISTVIKNQKHLLLPPTPVSGSARLVRRSAVTRVEDELVSFDLAVLAMDESADAAAAGAALARRPGPASEPGHRARLVVSGRAA